MCTFGLTQSQNYLWVHGKSATGNQDSILFASDKAKIDCITFSTNSPAPALSSLSTNIAAAGTTIMITGTNFPNQATCKVFFGAVEGVVNSATTTTISVTVPTLTFLSANTTILVKNSLLNQSSNTLNFTAWNPANLYTDNFNRTSTAWDNTGVFPSLIGANWVTSQGDLQINSNFLNSTGNGRIIFRNSSASVYPGRKFILEADLKVNHASDPASFAGIAFNIQNDGQTYQLVRISATGLVQALTTSDNGMNWSVNLSNNYALPGLQYYHFQITADGSNTYQLKISKMDGTIMLNTSFTSSMAVTGYKVGLYSLGSLSMYDNFSLLLENTTADYIPLFGDNLFLRGFNLRSTDSANPAIVGNLNYDGTALGNSPYWNFGQWHCVNNDMQTAAFTNVGTVKKYKVGTDGNELIINSTGKISFVLNTTTEYGLSTTNPHNPRQAADPWPTMLIEHELTNAQTIKIASSNEIRMQMNYTVTMMNNLTPSYNAGLHTAQFLWYITIQNRNTSSPDYGKYIWFGLNMHDFRYQYAALHASPDAGPNNTGMFIYSPNMRPIMESQGPAQVGKNFSIDVNVLPLIQEAFTTAKVNNFLSNTTWDDLHIGGMNTGLEVPGTFDVAIDINSFNIKYK